MIDVYVHPVYEDDMGGLSVTAAHGGVTTLIIGLFPKKGILQRGSDADLVLFDPSQAFTIQHRNQHSRAPYTLYEGRQCLGRPTLVMQRGQVLVEDGTMKAKPGQGRFLSMNITKVKC